MTYNAEHPEIEDEHPEIEDGMELRNGCVFEYEEDKYNRTLLILKNDKKYGCEGLIAIKEKDTWKVLSGKQIIFNAWKNWMGKRNEQ